MEKKNSVRVEHLEYLNAVGKNTLAWLVSQNHVTLADNKSYTIDYGRVVLLNGNYLKIDNERRKKNGLEPLTKVAALPWGEWEINGILINHNGERYLRYYPYDGEMQEVELEIRDENGEDLQPCTPVYDEVYEAWSGSKKPSSSCRNIHLDKIVELTTLDADGYPEDYILWLARDNDK